MPSENRAGDIRQPSRTLEDPDGYVSQRQLEHHNGPRVHQDPECSYFNATPLGVTQAWIDRYDLLECPFCGDRQHTQSIIKAVREGEADG